MRQVFNVLSEETKTGVRKGSNEKWKMVTLSLIDAGNTKPRCKTVLEMNLSDDDMELEGQLEGTHIEVDVLNISAGYKGAIEIRGQIVREETATSGVDFGKHLQASK